MKIRLASVKAEVNYGEFKRTQDLSEYYSLDDVFSVYGISSRGNSCDFYIFDGNNLVLIANEFVEIIDDLVKPFWRLKVWEDRGITIWPALFYQEDFLENFSEWEEKERKQFEILRKEIENE